MDAQRFHQSYKVGYLLANKKCLELVSRKVANYLNNWVYGLSQTG